MASPLHIISWREHIFCGRGGRPYVLLGPPGASTWPSQPLWAAAYPLWPQRDSSCPPRPPEHPNGLRGLPVQPHVFCSLPWRHMINVLTLGARMSSAVLTGVLMVSTAHCSFLFLFSRIGAAGCPPFPSLQVGSLEHLLFLFLWIGAARRLPFPSLRVEPLGHLLFFLRVGAARRLPFPSLQVDAVRRLSFPPNAAKNHLGRLKAALDAPWQLGAARDAPRQLGPARGGPRPLGTARHAPQRLLAPLDASRQLGRLETAPVAPRQLGAARDVPRHSSAAGGGSRRPLSPGNGL